MFSMTVYVLFVEEQDNKCVWLVQTLNLKLLHCEEDHVLIIKGKKHIKNESFKSIYGCLAAYLLQLEISILCFVTITRRRCHSVGVSSLQ